MIPHALFLTAGILGFAWLTLDEPPRVAAEPIEITSLPAPETVEPSGR